jgi:hypothetical protein
MGGYSRLLAGTLLAMGFASGVQAQCVGNCGTLGANGVVTASPIGGSYQFVSTSGGVAGAGQLAGAGGTNGSSNATASFSALAGSTLSFYFNYVTSDGAGFSDYAWSQLQTPGGTSVATLFSARTTPSGNTVPGFGLPGLLATLTPASTPIIAGAPSWSPLGGDSGRCFAAGCGYTGWIKATYTIANAGNYRLAFGVTNSIDTDFDSGLAYAGVFVDGNPVGGIPEPSSWAMLIAGFGLVGAASRRHRMAVA